MDSLPASQNNAHSGSPYDADNFMLTKEEEAALSQIEEKHQASQSVQDPAAASTPTASPARKKRKRQVSSERSPHVSPYKLRSSVKVSSRAWEAGYRPNIARGSRQKSPNSEPVPSVANERSTSLEQGTSSVPVVGPSGMPINAIEQPKVVRVESQGQGSDATRRSESLGPMHRASNTGRRSESVGPVNPQLLSSGAVLHSAAVSHTGHQQYAFQPYPPPYAPPPGFLFPNPPYQCNPAPSMPVEGANPFANVFSAQYVPPCAPQGVVQASGASCQSFQLAPMTRGSSTLSESGDNPVGMRPAQAITQRAASSSGAASLPGPVKLSTTDAAQHASSNRAPAPTPMPAVLPKMLGSELLNAGADSDDLGDSPSRGPLDCESPTIGRLSNAARHALRLGFDKLDAVVKRISGKTGLAPVQIVERWDATKTRLVSSWNIYQGFFEERRDTELGRLPVEDRPLPGAIPDKSIISACYESFKAAKPESYDEILRTWHRLRIMADKGEMTISRRAREFKKHVEKIDNLFRHASNLFGFESICITVGGVVNQDQNLAHIVASSAATDFFLERFRATDSLALGQMKAHVYDRLSKHMVEEEGAQLFPQSAASPVNPTSSKQKDAIPAAGETNVLAELKERFIAMAAKHNIAITKGSSLHWKGLPQIIAEAGCILVNWPEDVSFPCDEAGGKSTSKGIAILKLPARAQLLAAFDHPTFPLHIEKKYSTAVPKDHPVIIGVPPDSTSAHTFGCRKFLDDNQNEDRNGPPRCKPTSSSRSANHVVRTSKALRAVSKAVESRPPKPVINDIGNSSDDDRPLVVDVFDDEDPETPKPPRKATKSRNKAWFKCEAADSPYSSSVDGDPQYSGSDLDSVPVARSPLNLRSKAPMRNLGRAKPGALKHSRGGKTKEQGDPQDARPAAKKRALEPASASGSSTGLPGSSIQPPPPSTTLPVIQEATAADIVAEKLFGSIQAHEQGKSAPAAAEDIKRSSNPSASAQAGHHDGSAAALPVLPKPPQVTALPQPRQGMAPPPPPHTMPPPSPPRPHHGMPPPQSHHGVLSGPQPHHTMPPPHPGMAQQSHMMQMPGYPEGYFAPYPNAPPMPPYPHPHAPMWYSQPPPTSSSSSLPGSGYAGHQIATYWPNQGQPAMYAGAFNHYPAQHPPQPQQDGMEKTEPPA